MKTWGVGIGTLYLERISDENIGASNYTCTVSDIFHSLEFFVFLSDEELGSNCRKPSLTYYWAAHIPLCISPSFVFVISNVSLFDLIMYIYIFVFVCVSMSVYSQQLFHNSFFLWINISISSWKISYMYGKNLADPLAKHIPRLPGTRVVKCMAGDIYMTLERLFLETPHISRQ